MQDNYLRNHRKKAGLSQRELARLCGTKNAWNVRRHETSRSMPPFLTGLAYSAIFREPVSAIFSGAHLTVSNAVEASLAEFEADLRARIPKGRETSVVSQKLRWLTERKKG